MKILIFNAGSSSQKTILYEITDSLPDDPPNPLWDAHADWTEKKDCTELTIHTNGQTVKSEIQATNRVKVIEETLKTLWTGQTKVINDLSEIAVVGHRVVHGGTEFHKATRVTPQVVDKIRQLSVFAPLHNISNAEGIEAIEKIKPDLPQIAVFDTAFHDQLSRTVATYPGPYEWFDEGIRRYGFHGISHQYCTRKSAQIVGTDPRDIRLINCHLGNGCSLAAIKNGTSIDTTMGFTPLEGLMMGTRSGSIDPSILTYLLREKGYDAEKLDKLLNKQSGIAGISGISADMRSIHQAITNGNERARLALDMFIYRLRYFIGAMMASLGGVDVLTFTGGIGENDEIIRATACENFGFLNLKLDLQKNHASPLNEEISTPDSAVHVLIVHTQEDWEIARDCWKVIQTAQTMQTS